MPSRLRMRIEHVSLDGCAMYKRKRLVGEFCLSKRTLLVTPAEQFFLGEAKADDTPLSSPDTTGESPSAGSDSDVESELDTQRAHVTTGIRGPATGWVAFLSLASFYDPRNNV